jgi:hypothetical protein
MRDIIRLLKRWYVQEMNVQNPCAGCALYGLSFTAEKDWSEQGFWRLSKLKSGRYFEAKRKNQELREDF